MLALSSMQIKSVDFRNNRNKEHLLKLPRGVGVGRGGCQLTQLGCWEGLGRPWKLFFRYASDGGDRTTAF